MQDHPKYASLSGAAQYANYVNGKRAGDRFPIEITEAMILDHAIDDTISVWGRFSGDFKAGVGILKEGLSSISDIRKCLPVSDLSDVRELKQASLSGTSESLDKPINNGWVRRKAMKVIGFSNRRRIRSKEEVELYIQMQMYQQPEFNRSGTLVATKHTALNRQQAEQVAYHWVEKTHPYIGHSELLPVERLLNCSAVEARLKALRWGKKVDRNDVNLVLLDRQNGSCAVLLNARKTWSGSVRSERTIVASWPDGAELLFDLTDVAKVFGDEGNSATEGGNAEAQNSAADCDKSPLPKRTGTGAETISEYLRSGKASSDFAVEQLVKWMLVQQDGAKGEALWRQKKDRFTRSDGVNISRGGLRKAVSRYHDDIRFGETATTANET